MGGSQSPYEAGELDSHFNLLLESVTLDKPERNPGTNVFHGENEGVGRSAL